MYFGRFERYMKDIFYLSIIIDTLRVYYLDEMAIKISFGNLKVNEIICSSVSFLNLHLRYTYNHLQVSSRNKEIDGFIMTSTYMTDKLQRTRKIKKRPKKIIIVIAKDFDLACTVCSRSGHYCSSCCHRY